MSQSTTILLMLAVLVPLWIRLRRDFVSGLSYAIVVLLVFTPLVRIQTPGALPELTIHRLILFVLFLAWFRHPERRQMRTVPLRGLLFAWAGIAFISLLGGVDKISGVKRYLDFVLELFLFYFIVATSVQSREDGLRLLRAAVLGLALVGVMATVEKYTGVNVVDRFVGMDDEGSPVRDIRATYRHRILLGAAMAMGWPLALAEMQLAATRFRRRLAWGAVAIMLAACYYAMSRGPWLAAGLAGMLLVVMGSEVLRKPLIIVGLLGMMVLVTRPGVLNTLAGYASATVDKDSFKGGTFKYRLELWLVAFDSVKTSPWRFLFGFGPSAGANQSIDWTLTYRDKDFRIESWDNDFAYSLYQYGVLGMAATMFLYGSIAWRLLREARWKSGFDRDLYLCLCASTLVLFFMMSNVHVFARQLYYLLWTLAAIGLAVPEEANSEEPVLESFKSQPDLALTDTKANAPTI